ncbi:cuticle protein 6-like [Orussus abietinus]|uniref:cuticle protein 6-like n=1 Tax=Orussus abietinus TaxID=222816 RepID=UPI000C715B9B|nr:cuticle protein 6-like [Orussus abietinus]
MSISRGSGKPTEVYLGYQDSLGQYSFGYSTPLSARSEIRTADGATRGYYSYVDADGRIQSAEYTADANYGFRIAATNLPQAPLPVEETAEVAAARAAHLRAVEMAEKRAAQEAQMQPGSVKDEEIQAEAGIRNEEEELRPFGALALSQPGKVPPFW